MSENAPVNFQLADARRIADATRAWEELETVRNRLGENAEQVTAAKLTSEVGNGHYKATEVLWNGTAWVTFTSGRNWNGIENAPSDLYEINATLLLPNDSIVFPYLFTDSNDTSHGGTQWMFEVGLDRLVTVSSNDTTSGDLETKLLAGTAITMTTQNDGGNETRTINVDTSGTDQNLWETITSDSGSAVANTPTDTLTVVGSGVISTAIVGDTLTISSTGAADQNLWLTISSDSGSVAADTPTDTLTIAGADPMDTAVSGDTVTVTFDHTSISGYNASVQQVLTHNASGVLTWVDTKVC